MRTVTTRATAAVFTRSGRTPLRKVLHTADGVAIDAAYEPGPGRPGEAGSEPVFVVAHGFTGDLDRPHVRRAVRVFAQRAAVVTFSFRGHGRSGGRSTVGDREVLDVAAAVDWARFLGHTRVVTVGFSMGGAVVLRHAAGGDFAGRAGRAAEGARIDGEHEGRTQACKGAHEETGACAVDAVVAVSAPARWYYRGTAPMRRLHWLVMHPLGRVVGRYGLRTRIHSEDWDPVPLSPTEAAALLAPAPLLIVHGDRDPYFPLDHPRMLADAAGDSGTLWLEPGMGHAENGASDALLERIADWAASRAG